MGEQRYKVGDWVRVKDNRGAPRDYKVGDVCQVTKIEDDIVRCGEAGMFAKRFEPWQPRVGERVRVVRAELQHKFASIGREFTVINEAYMVGNGVQTWGGDKAGGFVWRADELEPILAAATPEKPATLKIEAGKFYKTRDGRKVGPAFISGNIATFGSTSNHASAVWSDDGRSSNRDDKTSLKDKDIIAEWIDEPAAKAEASNDNAQPKFKIGDLVRVVKEGFTKGGSGHGANVGDVFTLKDMNSAKTFWRTDGPDFYEHELDPVLATAKVATPTTTIIVALIENGQPKPSSTPHVHTSTSAAEKEAKRLAAKYKGQQFGVFTLTTTHEKAAPVYDHKWQNMAYLGLKIDAIKELHSITGMGLKPAKDAVEYFLAAA